MPVNARNDLVYGSTKTYTHAQGLSCCFRQHKAKSHCRFLHGYALEVKLTFSATVLDENNWVVDFGGLKDVKQWLELMFDHKLLIAVDDYGLLACSRSQLHSFAAIHVVPATGCEAFSWLIYEHVERWLKEVGLSPRVLLDTVEVREHGGNSAMTSRKEYRDRDFRQPAPRSETDQSRADGEESPADGDVRPNNSR